MSRAVVVPPEGEQARVRAVRAYDVPQSGTQASFDDFASIAAAACHAPMAAVNLVGESAQWPAGSLGLPVQALPRTETFCLQVVQTAATLVVPDATDDERFRALPAVLHSGIRFYAGVPLVDPDGHVLGALCILDTVPRQLQAAERDVLERLALRVVDNLELRTRSRQLASDRELLQSTSVVSGLISGGADLPEVLLEVARAVERREPEVLCSILLLDGDRLRPGAGPSLPADYSAGLDGVVIGLGVGCCGEAAFTGKPAVAGDIDTDPRWADYLFLTQPAGLKACWSTPIVDGAGTVLGTFAMYFRTARLPQPEHWALARQWVELAGLAITRTRELAQIRVAARPDPLTGLPNRSALLRACTGALPTAGPSSQVALLFVDLDRFKVVNDSLGHAVGDDYLVAIAGRLQAAAGPQAMVSRFGGDEFVVLGTGLAGSGDAIALAERLVACGRLPVELGGRQVTLSISVGVGVAAGGAVTATALLRDADAALYEAKHRGRDRVQVFGTEMFDAALRRLEIESGLRVGVARGQFRVVFQPKVELRTGAVVGVEALMRWRDPVRGEMPPSEFIPVAEDSGQIVALGEWVLRTALAEHAARRAVDPGWRDVALWVNIAPAQLTPCFPGLVADCAAQAGVPLDRLGLELTESSLMADIELAREVLASLRQMRVRLALDDFGTGYSSLGQLKHLPVDVLKIDKCFIDGLGHDSKDEGIVVAVLALARAHGLLVVAEGVETVEQCRQLRALGCPVLQGYHCARPGPLAGVRAAYSVDC